MLIIYQLFVLQGLDTSEEWRRNLQTVRCDRGSWVGLCPTCTFVEVNVNFYDVIIFIMWWMTPYDLIKSNQMIIDSLQIDDNENEKHFMLLSLQTCKLAYQ